MRNFRKKAIIVLSGIAVLAAIVGVYQAIHSPLFTIQVVEVNDQVSLSQAAAQTAPRENPWVPVDAQAVTDLAAVPVGEANLFDLDLRSVEKRILSNEWIREVRLTKRFPQTLSITPIYRDPKALIALETGVLAYVDQDGRVFGKVSLAAPKDLPLITGVDSENSAMLRDLLGVLAEWEAQPASKSTRIESVSDDAEKGYRLMVSYNLDHHLIHSRIDLGHDFSLVNLAQVFEYLRAHAIAARQVWADSGKKIVVKTAHGS